MNSTQLDISREICPECKSQQVKALKSWTIKGRIQKRGAPRGTFVKGKRNTIEITQYQCKMCSKKFRRGRKI